MSYYTGPYGQTPHYGGYGQPGGAPGMGAPGMGAPPGVPAPGVSGPPGMQQTQQQNSGSFGHNFQPPPNMPNINFSAPVIRLGMSGPPQKPDTPTAAAPERKGPNADPVSNRRGMGLGFENRDQQRNREPQVALAPQTREEVARTIFVGNITDSFGGDEGLEKILSCAGGLRKWLRVIDADGKPCTFGFAEYEDADSLATAAEIFQHVHIKAKDQPKEATPKTNGVSEVEATDEDADMKDGAENDETSDAENHEEAEHEPNMDKLLVVIDEKSHEYIEEWRSRGSLKSHDDAQFHLEKSKEDLDRVLMEISTPQVNATNEDVKMGEDAPAQPPTETRTDAVTGEVVTIPLTVEDELSDIPADMRETVTKEIAAFRERSNKRDMERLRREQEIEAQEKARNAGPSATASTSTIPLGPRAQQGPPTGPKGMTGVQLPRDYQKGVNFVNGTIDGITGLNPEDEDSDASDEELERRRQEKRKAMLEKQYLEQERKWIARERARTAAIEREMQREGQEAERLKHDKVVMRDRLASWDDDMEASRRVEEYYYDRSAWLRNRARFRAKEAEMDEVDRALEEREKQMEQEKRNKEIGVTDDFLAEQSAELELKLQKQPQHEPQKLTISLGGAMSAKRHEQEAGQQRRNLAAVEGLLDNEEEIGPKEKRRELIPLAEETSKASTMSAEERGKIASQLAREIPTGREGLWAWDVKWDSVDGGIMTDLRKFAEKKSVDYLGIQDRQLIEDVEEVVRNRSHAKDLVGKLRKILAEDAESFVKKLWRMLIFYTESERRGLSY